MSRYFLNFCRPRVLSFCSIHLHLDSPRSSKLFKTKCSLPRLCLQFNKVDSRLLENWFQTSWWISIVQSGQDLWTIYSDLLWLTMIELCLTMIYYAYHAILILHAGHFPHLDLGIWFARYRHSHAGFGEHRRPSLLLRLISISGLKPSKLNPKWSRSFRVWKLIYIYI